MTQCDRILAHLKDRGSLSQREALELYGCMRLGSRVHDLRKRGIKIITATEEGTNRYGEKTHWARYSLVDERDKAGRIDHV